MPPDATTSTGPLHADDATVVAAMGVEAWAVRRRVPQIRLIRGGIGLATMRDSVTTPVALSVGLAGGLAAEHSPGTVVIPSRIGRAGGVPLATDPAWTAALLAASRRLGFPTLDGALITTDVLVTDATRHAWAAHGFVAVDMESSAIAALTPRVAAVRVILDTPVHEISPAWVRPARAALNPRNWREGAWLLRTAPRLSLRAAQVLAEALRGEVDAEV